MTWPIAAATAHRRLYAAEPWVRDQLGRIAVKLRDEHGTTAGISGMALGGDTIWANATLAARLDLWAYIPFPQQPAPWPHADRVEWQRLRSLAAREQIFGDHYDVRFLHARNEGMVDDSAVTVAVWDGTHKGGTYAALKCAVKKARPVILVDPRRRTVTLPSGDRLREMLGMHRSR